MKEKTPTVESVLFLAIQLTLLGEMSSMIVKIDALAGSQLCYICCSLYKYIRTLHTVQCTLQYRRKVQKNVGTSRILLVKEGFASTMAKNWGGGAKASPWHCPVPPSLHHTESTQKRHSERQEHQIQDNIFKKVHPRPSFQRHTQRSRIQKLGLF